MRRASLAVATLPDRRRPAARHRSTRCLRSVDRLPGTARPRPASDVQHKNANTEPCPVSIVHETSVSRVDFDRGLGRQLPLTSSARTAIGCSLFVDTARPASHAACAGRRHARSSACHRRRPRAEAGKVRKFFFSRASGKMSGNHLSNGQKRSPGFPARLRHLGTRRGRRRDASSWRSAACAAPCRRCRRSFG